MASIGGLGTCAGPFLILPTANKKSGLPCNFR